jgi:hypothetical protein
MYLSALPCDIADASQERWAKQAQRPENADLALLFISDVRLDEDRTLKGLRRLFEQAVEAEVIPKVFVLCGSFTSGIVSNDVEMDAYKGEHRCSIVRFCR